MKIAKKGFTLIEMLIVIVVIAIMLGFTMRFSGDRIWLLNNKNVQEEFIGAYDKLFATAMNTNYISGNVYNRLTLQLSSNFTGIKYIYYNDDVVISSGVDNILGKMKFVSSFIGVNRENTDISINFVPYVLGCTFNSGSTGVAKINISVNNENENYCFQISSNLGRLESVKCGNVE